MIDLEHQLEELAIHRRFAVDILSVARGVRGIGLIHAPLEATPALLQVLARADLCVFARRVLMRFEDPDSRERILRDCKGGENGNVIELWFVGQNPPSLPSADALFANPGWHLGYPRCCVAEWERLQSQRDMYQRYLFETQSGHWEINRLATLFQGGLLIPDFYPCSLSCNEARTFALPILGIAQEVLDPVWVRETVRWMKAPLLQHSESLYAFPNWAIAGSKLVLVLSDARRVPLKEVGRFEQHQLRETRSIAFCHLSTVNEAVLIGADGTKTAIPLGRERS